MFFLHSVPPPPVLYVADGVQTSQGAEAAKGLKEKKKDSETHIFLQTIRWTADVWRLAMVPPATTAPLKRRVRSCLTLDKPGSCHGMIYGACLWDFMFLGTWQWKPHPFCPSASSPGVHCGVHLVLHSQPVVLWLPFHPGHLNWLLCGVPGPWKCPILTWHLQSDYSQIKLDKVAKGETVVWQNPAAYRKQLLPGFLFFF